MPDLQEAITDDDIRYILENPWEKSKGEWRLSTPAEREETLQFILNRLRSTQAKGYSNLWKTPERESIALLGGYKVGETKYETFLIASRHMENHSVSISFEMRKILKEMAIKYKGCTCGQYAHEGQKAQISWFRFMGFKHRPEGDIGNRRYYEYGSPVS